ncbi:LCP family protein [Saccharopolyspora rhizosphaerae]|uniref:LCP family protein n=1 Tax=Saccharopolyspora rhizosphaerae TaxID=2492662 RepID=UPI001F39B03D|nr:LCP family protein [Saccharopolyspora rhizosphaerae]
MDEPEQGQEPPGPDGTSDPPQRSAARIVGRSVVALASVAVLGLSAVGWFVTDRLSEVSSAKVLAEVPDAPPPDDGATDVLLVGSDSRTDAQGNPLPLRVLKQLRTEATGGLNTDSLVLIRVPHSGAPPTAVSIPRDTSTPAPSGRNEKINSVYGLTKQATSDELEGEGLPAAEVERRAKVAGQRALVQTVQTLTGLRIDHYAEINLLGFFELTDAVGGVEVCLNSATSDKDSGADFSAGRQTVTGGDALSFVRQRHGLPRGDLDRIVRQQVFMAGLANKVLSTGTLTDPARVNELVAATQRTVELDEAWDPLGFVQQMQQVAAGRVSFVTMPVLSAGARDDRGQSIVSIDRQAVQRFFAGLAVNPPGMAPKPGLRLDGTAKRQPITSDGDVPCVN